MECYVSFFVGDLCFIDFFQFMSSLFEILVNNMICEGFLNFKYFSNYFKDDEMVKFLLWKNVYCYDYIDSYEKFEEKKLLFKEVFYNCLKKEYIFDVDYVYV